MKRQFSAGGLVYKKSGDEILWLIRRPTPNPEFHGNLGWSFPKGWLDDADEGLNPGPLASGLAKPSEDQIQAAALREVREEGGIVAKIIKKLSTVRTFFTNHDNEKVMKFITYYQMEYLSDAPEGHDFETEEVRWVSKNEAQELLAYKSDKELLINV